MGGVAEVGPHRGDVQSRMQPDRIDRDCQPAHAGYFALPRTKLKLASCPARVIAFAWQPMHVPS